MTHRIRMLMIVAAGLIVLLVGGARAHADLLGGYVSPRERNAATTELLERSESLRDLAEANPALAQIVLQRLQELAAQHGVSLLADPADAHADGLDLEPLRRVSPTAVLDLIELLKQASKTRQVEQRPSREE